MSLSADLVSLVHYFQTSAELVITGCWLQLKRGIDLMIVLSAGKQISIFSKTSNSLNYYHFKICQHAECMSAE